MMNAASVVQTELFSDRDQEAMIAKFVKEVFKEGVGKNIPSARKTTMEQYLKNSLRVFSKAFNKDNVQDGFRAVSSCCVLLHMLASFVLAVWLVLSARSAQNLGEMAWLDQAGAMAGR